MSKMTGAEAIIKSVRRYDVDTIFGLPGGQTYHLFDAILQRRRLPQGYQLPP